MIHFTINDHPFESPETEVTVEQLLARVGQQLTDVELVRVATGQKWTKPSDVVELHDGDAFATKRHGDPDPPVETSIHYTVNGEPQVTEESPLTVEQILRGAGAAAAVDINRLESYYIEDARSGARYENLGDPVPVTNGGQFLALYAGSTPVA